MKNLKNKIFAGTFALASLGIFGNKNANAQIRDTLPKESIKISFECWEGNDPSERQEKALPCFNNYKTPNNMLIKLNKANSEVEINYNFYHVEKIGNIGKFECNGDLLKIMLFNKNIRGRADEFFHICYKTGIISYIRNIHKGKEIVPMINQEELTTQDIYKKFGGGFANRIREIINARGDSLKMVNLIKKEYEMGKLINENGEIEKVVHRFY